MNVWKPVLTCVNLEKSDVFLETGGDLAEKPQNVQIEEKTVDTITYSQL